MKNPRKKSTPAARARAAAIGRDSAEMRQRFRFAASEPKGLDGYEKARFAAEQKCRPYVGGHVTHVRERLIRCGKPRCRACPHGVYFYERWKDDAGKVRERYLGKFRPATYSEVSAYERRAVERETAQLLSDRKAGAGAKPAARRPRPSRAGGAAKAS